MAKYNVLQMLYNKTKPQEEFDFDMLQGPSVYDFFSQDDINQLNKIATSARLSGNMRKKLNMIDAIMKSRGFRKFAGGTNRVVYTHYEFPSIVAKVAIDRVGLGDNPAEFRNQEFLKPFVAKCFSISPDGVIAICEKVLPITNLSEFESVSDYIFQIIVFKILGKYVIDDIGVEYFLNWGIRVGSFPCLLDYPYLYKLNSSKLKCHRCDTKTGNIPCNGDIDYDEGFNHLVCTKCGTVYKAKELGLSLINDLDKFMILKGEKIMKVTVVMSDGREFNPIEESEFIQKKEPLLKKHRNISLDNNVFITNIDDVTETKTLDEKEEVLPIDNTVVEEQEEVIDCDTIDISNDNTEVVEEKISFDEVVVEDSKEDIILPDNIKEIDIYDDYNDDYSIDNNGILRDNKGRFVSKNKKLFVEELPYKDDFSKKSGKKKHKSFDRKDSIRNMDMY